MMKGITATKPGAIGHAKCCELHVISNISVCRLVDGIDKKAREMF